MARPVVKKQAIEDAAIRLFATKGLARTTVKDIAKEAGVTEGALYRHYAGKDEMALQLFRQELERFTQALRTTMYANGSSNAERLERGVRYIFSYYRENPIQFTFIMLTQHGFPGQHILDRQVNPNDLAVDFIKEAMEAGDIPQGDPVLAAGLAMGLVLQPLVMHQNKRLALTPAVEDTVVEAAKRVLFPEKQQRGGA